MPGQQLVNQALTARVCPHAHAKLRYCSAKAGQCDTGVHLAWSTSLSGPWEYQYNVLNFSCTNPDAPVFNSNGSLLMAYKTWGKQGKIIGTVVAPSWRAWPYTQAAFIGAAPHLEDPSNLWRDERGV